jgi:hypothetical protein
MTALLHALSGNLTPIGLRDHTWSLPIILFGIVAGSALERWLSPARFRQIVLLGLIPLRLRMIL